MAQDDYNEWRTGRSAHGVTRPTGDPSSRGRYDAASQLPPHDTEAEAGVLGCCLLDSNCVALAEEYFAAQPCWMVFYSPKHQVVFKDMTRLRAENVPVDLITLQGKLNMSPDGAGIELEWLMGLQDKVPSAANLLYYLQIVWGKFLERRMLATVIDAGASIQSGEKGLEPVLSAIKARVDQIERAAARHGGAMPAHLKHLEEFEAAYFNAWFGSEAGEPGLPLPFEFPFKVRRGEQTFLIAEKGAGKSTLMAYILLHLCNQGEKACIASMEMKPHVTLKMMAAQLLGRKELPDSQWGQAQAVKAFDWLRKRIIIYDFLGIADWQDIYHAFDYAATAGYTQFQIDSVMRMGIPDDDYAQQGRASSQFASWAQNRNVHNWIVNHLNKSDKSTKQRSRGSQQWIDNCNNVVSVHINEKKAAQLEELKRRLAAKEVSSEEYDEQARELYSKFDSYFDLHNQRWPGSRQNGRRYLFFNREGLQLQERPFLQATNWLTEWEKKTALATDQTQMEHGLGEKPPVSDEDAT